MLKGVVIKSTGSWYLVRTPEAEKFQCRLAGKLRLDNRRTTNPVAVGDLVEFSKENHDSGVIQQILPRKNYIIRKSLNLSRQAHILASNIDQAILVVTLFQPRTSTGFIDRFLVTAEAYRIPAMLIFNKRDLLSEDVLNIQQELIMLYEKLGYPCFTVSSLNNKSVESIKNIFKDKTSLISGHSGVGKSTLINSIQPELNLRVGEISQIHDKGKHTTTFAELFELDFGGFIIDTPGIKELGVLEMKREEVGHYFPEFRNLLNECRFNNCTHTNEPACAVLNALSEGKIDEGRYYNYCSILSGEEMNWKSWE
ncbi:MAG: ribosome small subunit-dependent GTPase A [Bacteroidota bacterium]